MLNLPLGGFFCSKLRAPHRGSSLGPFECDAIIYEESDNAYNSPEKHISKCGRGMDAIFAHTDFRPKSTTVVIPGFPPQPSVGPVPETSADSKLSWQRTSASQSSSAHHFVLPDIQHSTYITTQSS
jgi:hypothetical protein